MARRSNRLSLLSFKKFDSNYSQRNGDQSQGIHNDYVGVGVQKVNVIHKHFLSNSKETHKYKVPKKTSQIKMEIASCVNIKLKFGTINTAPYQAADKLTVNADNVLNAAFRSFLVKNAIKNSRSGRDIELNTLYHKVLSLSSRSRFNPVPNFYGGFGKLLPMLEATGFHPFALDNAFEFCLTLG